MLCSEINSNVLYCVVLCCVALRCVALRCVALRCVALHCIALHCIVLYCTLRALTEILLYFVGDGLSFVPCVYICVAPTACTQPCSQSASTVDARLDFINHIYTGYAQI